MKIMIVDDNEQSLYLLEVLLRSEKYEVVCARDGLEALKHLKKGSFGLIISDILMPRMDGFQLCRECKVDPHLKYIPFIFYTATYTDQKDEE
jgi:CheY-like chemotaxis protein